MLPEFGYCGAGRVESSGESNRAANNRPPGYARNWRSLLAFFGEDVEPAAEPVTLAEMDARVGRWGGWKPFRDEVARLLDCGWEPPTSTQLNPDPPEPQQAPTRTVSYEPANATIREGGSLYVRFSHEAEDYCYFGDLPDWLRLGGSPRRVGNLMCVKNNPMHFVTVDDNVVRVNRTFELHAYTSGPDESFPVQTITSVEDDIAYIPRRLHGRAAPFAALLVHVVS